MGFQYYKMILNVKNDKKLFQQENIEKLVYSKEWYNAKNQDEKYMLLLPSKNNKLNLILKTIAAPDVIINFNVIRSFVNLFKKEIQAEKEIIFKLEICKKINCDEVKELINDCESENTYFDSTDKRLILDENCEDQIGVEGKVELLKDSKSIKDALNKLEGIQGFEKLKNEAKKLMNYKNIINLKADYMINFHYLICCEENYLSFNVIKLFSEMLYYKKLIIRRVFVQLNAENLIDSFYYYDEENIKNSVGGVLIINNADKLIDIPEEDCNDILVKINKIIIQCKNKITVIFQASQKDNSIKLKKKLEENLIIRYVEEDLYSEDEVYNIVKGKILNKYNIKIEEDAKDGFLQALKIKNNDSKFGGLNLGERIFEISILQKFINSNVNSKNPLILRKEDFLNTQDSKAICKHNEARAELGSLIGLNTLKEKINEITNYLKVQKQRKDKGLLTQPICLHMEFTGNPGTCKTTVARIIGKLFKEIGLLKKGDFYEVGREDLVAKYVGWTAKTVSAKVKEAIGSVLFIDEAYSLYEDRSGGYGDEAISTLIKEMENHKDELVVIIAGYPNEMEELINKNLGFKDRIAFRLDFPDYNTEELTQIFEKFCTEDGYLLAENCIDYIKNKFQFIVENKNANFGNGRFARKFYEGTKLAQAKRIMMEKEDDKNLSLIEIEDIEMGVKELMPKKKVKTEKYRIGFAV